MSEEELARDAVACPRCHVAAGAGCHDSNGDPLPSYEGGPLIHQARLNVYREQQGGGGQ